MIFYCKAKINDKIVTAPVVASNDDDARIKFKKVIEVQQKNRNAPSGEITNIQVKR